MAKVLLDTNLLCLLIVGLTDRKKIISHKRLKAFTETDFDNLQELLANFTTLVTIPQVISETSNLLRHSVEPLRVSASASLAHFIRSAEEKNYSSVEIIDHPFYTSLGITDCAIMIASKFDVVILSADLDLFLAATRSGAKALNYNYFRDGAISYSDLRALFR